MVTDSSIEYWVVRAVSHAMQRLAVDPMPRRRGEGVVVVTRLKLRPVPIRFFVGLKCTSITLEPPALIYYANCIYALRPERLGGVPAMLSVRAGARIHREARECECHASGRSLEVTDSAALCLALP